MKKIYLIAVSIIILGGILLVGSTNALFNLEQKTFVYPMEQGKNFVIVNTSVSAKTLVKLNPDIETISYLDEETNESVGFVNAFGGIGKNFLLNKDAVYEISARRAFNMTVPA
ncbi:TPA: hypothetical protein ENS27_09385 [bacterium]|nr:hypothetical protein [bacterium]